MQMASEEVDLQDRTQVSMLAMKELPAGDTGKDNHNISNFLNEDSKTTTERSVIGASSKKGEGVLLHSHIKIDQRCLSCQVTGHDTSHILNLFKCACLLYSPSNVTFNFKSFKRFEFLAMRKAYFQHTFTNASPPKRQPISLSSGGIKNKILSVNEDEQQYHNQSTYREEQEEAAYLTSRVSTNPLT